MKLKVVWIGKTKSVPIRALTDEYMKRLSRYTAAEGLELRSEEALLSHVAKERARSLLVLLDQRGRQFTSEEFAELLRGQHDRSASVIFAVGPADGFTQAARDVANITLSFGKMTLAHELARVVLLEQLYRAFTIIKGHPYHTGH